jgi:hypothetical protein
MIEAEYHIADDYISPDSPDDFAHPPLMRTGFAIIDK